MKNIVHHFSSENSEATEAFAEQLGQRLKGGEVLELVSDLGGGKTTFVRGLARGLGSKDKVTSPTFTVSKVYHTPKLELHHFDFYRLNDGGMVAYELAEVIDDPQSVTVVEWAEIVHDVLPADRKLTIHIAKTGDEKRALTLECPLPLRYLLEDQ